MRTVLIMQSSCTVPGKETSTFAQLQTINQQHIPVDRLLLSHWKIIGQCLIFYSLKINFSTNWITAHGQMRQPGDVPQDGLVKSTGRCSNQQRSREVKLFHYERTRVAFIHSLLLLSRGGLRGNEDGYLTLEANGWLQTIHCSSRYGLRYGNCSRPHPLGGRYDKKGAKKVARRSEKFHSVSDSWMMKRTCHHPGWIIRNEVSFWQSNCAKTLALRPTLNNNNDHRGIVD